MNIFGVKYRFKLIIDAFFKKFPQLPISLEKYTADNIENIKKEIPIANANIFELLNLDDFKESRHLLKLARQENGKNPRSSELDAGRLLYNLILYKKPKIIIEVGTYIGSASSWLALAQKKYLNNPNIFLIDIKKNYLELTRKNLNKLGFSKGINFYLGDSVQVAESGNLPKASFIFIDADHSLEGIKRDIKAYWPLLKMGGLMVLHDSILWKGVRMAVNQSKNPVYTLASSGGSGISIIEKKNESSF